MTEQPGEGADDVGHRRISVGPVTFPSLHAAMPSHSAVPARPIFFKENPYMKNKIVHTIRNRNGLPVNLHVSADFDPQKFVYLFIHGLGGSVESPQSVAVCKGLHAAGMQVVAVDGSHSLNGAGTDLAYWQPADHINDLKCAVAWCRENIQGFPVRYGLAGMSMGGYAALQVAAEQPDRTSHVLAICPVTSGRNTRDGRKRNDPEFLKTMRRGGPIEMAADISGLPEGLLTAEAWLRWLKDIDLFSSHPALGGASALDILRTNNILVNLIVGSADTKTPPDHVHQVAKALPAAGFRIIKGADHVFSGRTDALQQAVRDMARGRRWGTMPIGWRSPGGCISPVP